MKFLEGNAIVVTGAGRGLGREYALHAASSGAALVVNDIDPDPAYQVVDEIVTNGGTAIAHVADITDASSAEAVISRCVSEFGALDGLVTNAGDFTTGSVHTQHLDHLRRMVEVNVLGVFNCAAHATRQMVAQGSGSIVNVCSAMMAGHAGLSGYAGTKGAVASFTYSWAAELIDTNVRVNAILPAARTRMAASFVDSLQLTPEERELAVSQQPEPHFVAPMVTYLLSSLSDGITGQLVHFIDNELGLVSHPMLVGATHKEPAWTTEMLAEIFDQDLRSRQLPLGLAAAELRSIKPRP